MRTANSEQLKGEPVFNFLQFIRFCISFSFVGVLLLQLTIVHAQGASNEEDKNEAQDKIEELRELLQVKELHTPEIFGELVFDGVLNEPAWQQAAEYEITFETYPAQLEAAPVKTIVRVGRYKDDIVFAFNAFDDQPAVAPRAELRFTLTWPRSVPDRRLADRHSLRERLQRHLGLDLESTTTK